MAIKNPQPKKSTPKPKAVPQTSTSDTTENEQLPVDQTADESTQAEEQVSTTETTEETSTDQSVEKTETQEGNTNAAPQVEDKAGVQDESVKSKFAEHIESLRQKDSEFNNIINGFENYIAKMKPGIPFIGKEKEGALLQYTFWKLLKYVIEGTSDTNFKKAWSLVLAYFHNDETGVFGERYVFRFAEYWNWSKDELDGFQRLVNLIRISANPETRSKIKSKVDVQRSVEKGINPDAANRIIGFYN